MSSFVCSPKHFNSIEEALKNLFVNNYQHHFYPPYTFKNVFPELYNNHHYSHQVIEPVISGIVDTLRRLNALCVCLQYKHHYVGTLNAEIESETNSLMNFRNDYKQLSPHGLYNALCCLNYQIETGHLKELRPLTGEEQNALMFLDEMIKHLAFYLVDQMPGDKTNRWSIE